MLCVCVFEYVQVAIRGVHAKVAVPGFPEGIVHSATPGCTMPLGRRRHLVVAGLFAIVYAGTPWCQESTSRTSRIRTAFNKPDGFASCAIVGSSGLLLHTRLGEEINSYDFVVRTNLAPLGGFEPVVGSKTSVRVMNTEALGTVILERACPRLKDGHNDFCPAYSIHVNSNKEGAFKTAMPNACRGITPMVFGKDLISSSDNVIQHFSRLWVAM